MNPQPDQSESVARERFASDLMFLVGRYHNESSVDANYGKAARMLREANAEVDRLRAASDDEGQR
jgi:hypothetical protein